MLVATDIASRGIDVEDLTHVINCDFPQDAETYVHRTGRTGRAGRTGTAISIVTPLTGAYPLVTLGFASVALSERISRLQWVCIGLIIGGMILSPGTA